jgi:hypothetical protein
VADPKIMNDFNWHFALRDMLDGKDMQLFYFSRGGDTASKIGLLDDEAGHQYGLAG